MKIGKKVCTITLSLLIILGIGNTVFATPISKLPNIPNNTLVVGKELFELDKVNSSQYNLNAFIRAAKTVDENNKVYYKNNGKWYTSKDIRDFNSFKNANGVDIIPNDILKINGCIIENEIAPEKPSQNDKTKVYEDGVYEGEAKGLASIIKVNVTIKDDKISQIDVIEQNETPWNFNKAKIILEQILGKQSIEVDNVSGATYSSKSIKNAVKNALDKANIKQNTENDSDNPIKTTDKDMKFTLDWYQDGDYSHDKDGADESIEQFVVTFNKPINPTKGTLKIIIPDRTKQDSYGEGKLGEIEVKMNGTSVEKKLNNINGGDRVTCIIRPDDAVKSNNRFILELTQDWECILNTEKTKIHYYDDKIKGFRLIGEGLEDDSGNCIEDTKGTGKITSIRDIELYKDECKPYIVAQKLIYDKIGMNGLQKAGGLGIVFNEPVQLYTKEMVDEGIIPPTIYKDHNPLTPNPSQIGNYENFLPEIKIRFEKIDDTDNILSDENGRPITIDGKYDLMADILSDNTDAKSITKALSIKVNEISHKFDLDVNTLGINRFRDYGLFYITPNLSLSPGKWRLVVSGISDDAGNEMDEYISNPFEIKPLFSIQSLTKEGIKIKFTEPFKGNELTKDGITLVITQYGEIVGSVFLQNLKEGQLEAEGKFIEPIEDELQGEYFINNIKYIVYK